MGLHDLAIEAHAGRDGQVRERLVGVLDVQPGRYRGGPVGTLPPELYVQRWRRVTGLGDINRVQDRPQAGVLGVALLFDDAAQLEIVLPVPLGEVQAQVLPGGDARPPAVVIVVVGAADQPPVDLVGLIGRQRLEPVIRIVGRQRDRRPVRPETQDDIGRFGERSIIETAVVVPVLGAVVEPVVAVEIFARIEKTVVVRIFVDGVQMTVAVVVLPGRPFAVQAQVVEPPVVIHVLAVVRLVIVVHVLEHVPGAVLVPVLPGVQLGRLDDAVSIAVE